MRSLSIVIQKFQLLPKNMRMLDTSKIANGASEKNVVVIARSARGRPRINALKNSKPVVTSNKNGASSDEDLLGFEKFVSLFFKPPVFS